MPPTDSVPAPLGAGSDHDTVRGELEDLVLIDDAVEVELDVGKLVDLVEAPVTDPGPRGKPRQRGLERDPATQLPACFGQGHFVAALAKPHRRFETGGASANDQDLFVGPFQRYVLRVPALPPFFSHRGVLGATDRCACLVADVTNVATDALADFVITSLCDLLGQERIGNGGACRTDEIDDALSNQPQHRLGRGKTSHADDRFVGHALDPGHRRLEPRFLGETRGAHFVAVVVHRDVPQVG